jgi:predicted XRE-type DNA-binding protein
MEFKEDAKLEITPSSGNVFQDLGFDEAESQHLRLRSTLMSELRKLIQDRELTQAAAAGLFGVSQPRVSNLVRGRIDLFSLDTLVDMLARAGVRVDVELSAPGPESARPGATP